MTTTATCLCGVVTITVAAADDHIGACHCQMCQKWAGGPLMTIDCGTDVTINDTALVSTFSSSDWAERGFCKQCGSHLFYHLKPTGQYIMPAGLFDGNEHREFDHQIFIEQKPSYYSFANQTKNMTGEEVFAQFEQEQQ